MANSARGVAALGHISVKSFPAATQHVVGVAATKLVAPEGATVLNVYFLPGGANETADIVAGNYVATDTFTSAVATDLTTVTGHNFVTGDGPYQLTTTTTLPDGLALATDYWVYVVDANTIQFCASLHDATNQSRNDMGGAVDKPNVVDILDTGTGTHTIQSGFPTIPAATAATLAPNQIRLKSDGLTATKGDSFTAPPSITVVLGHASSRLIVWWS